MKHYNKLYMEIDIATSKAEENLVKTYLKSSFTNSS